MMKEQSGQLILEGHLIWEAIDTGGGQTCDIPGVLRELERAGFTIVPKRPEQMHTETCALMTAKHAYQGFCDCGAQP